MQGNKIDKFGCIDEDMKKNKGKLSGNILDKRSL